MPRNPTYGEPTDPPPPTPPLPLPPTLPPLPAPHQPTAQHPPNKAHKGRHTKANIKISSLNMRGQTNPPNILSPPNKWSQINDLLRDKKLGVLALQETHLSLERCQELNAFYGKRMHLLASPSHNPTQAGGVAFAINREITNIQNIRITDIIPGRAILLQLPWHKDLTISILNIYAPNPPNENAEFWSHLLDSWTDHRLPKPDILLGDFNMVEDSLDRLPCHPDPTTPTEALSRFRNHLNLVDGWRHTFPTTREYTFLRPNGTTQSRLDRIYTTRAILQTATEWTISDTAIFTDHRVVSVRISHRDLPFIGRGRWTIPLFLLSDNEFISNVSSKASSLYHSVRHTTPAEQASRLPQRQYTQFKKDIQMLARLRARKLIPKLAAQIEHLKSDLTATLNPPPTTTEGPDLYHAAILQARIKELESTRRAQARTTATAKYHVQGERISRYWSSTTKQRAPRDVIFSLRKPDSPPHLAATRSDKMSRLASEYHESLQTEGLPPPSQTRTAAIRHVLSFCESKLNKDGTEILSTNISTQEVREAIRASHNNKATGLDGIPYELWKILQSRFDELPLEQQQDDGTLNPSALLAILFNNIEIHGLFPDLEFTKGWMCPLYKKKERDNIANYRPITVLNSDYKLLTKTLTTKLLSVIPQIVHPDQAGFIPGRSIHDQTQLSKLIIDYAEKTGEAGAIVALDQEKAYDKIAHDYLWETLRAFGIPQTFISTMQTLYSAASTVVIINGTISTPYKVTRGVRQGDPLSCPVFDIAIEPLACMLRRSTIRGFQIPGLPFPVITSLFADDTSVFLSKYDKFSDLETTLKQWCDASSAKFNTDKTILIPIGPPEFREKVARKRRLNRRDQVLPTSIHIALDTEPTRILGAWIGNNVDQPAIWSTTLDKVRAALTRWGKCNPSLRGKRLIVQMVIGGMTQYLAKAQGMPPVTENILIALIRDFIHGPGKHPTISYETLCAPPDQGGLGLLNIRARNEAIEITWLRSYLNLNPSRPKWAYIADILIGECITRKSGNIDRWSRINVFLQTWDVNTQSRSGLHPDLARMLKTAKKYNAVFGAIKLSAQLKRDLPAWYHIGARPHFKFFSATTMAQCLRDKHHVRSIGDLMKVARRLQTPGPTHHRENNDCTCKYCRHDRQQRDCNHPHECADLAKLMLTRLNPKWDPATRPPHDGLSLTSNRKAANQIARTRNEDILFDPSVTTNCLSDGFRIFADDPNPTPLPAYRPKRTRGLPDETTTVWTDGSCTNNGAADARAGSGLWYGQNDPRNSAFRVPGPTQTNQVAEVLAVIIAAMRAPRFAPLYIVSDSMYTIDGLTKHLSHWEAIGWIGVQNKTLFQAAAYHLRQRGAPTYFRWIKGHSDDPGNDGADALAAEGAMLPTESAIDLSVPPAYQPSGARLSYISQAIAYQGILAHKTSAQRPTTQTTTNTILSSILNHANIAAPATKLWSTIRHQDFDRKISDFLWKCLHGIHKCGKYWSHFLPERVNCPSCHTTESLEHILYTCTTPGQQYVWTLASSFWTRTGLPWPIQSADLIMGCSLLQCSSTDNRPLPGRTRLLRILVSESAYLIWKLRCERVIGNAEVPNFQHSLSEIKKRFHFTINRRLNLDCAISRRSLSIPDAHHTPTRQTWRGLLRDEEYLPPSWAEHGNSPVYIWTTPYISV